MIKTILVNKNEVKVNDLKLEGNLVSLKLDGQVYQFSINQVEDGLFSAYEENKETSFKILGTESFYSIDGNSFEFDSLKLQRGAKKSLDEGSLVSPMPGKILKLMVTKGDQVVKGQPLMVLEAMKMEHTIKSNEDGVVESIAFKIGDQVTGGVELVQIN